MSHRLVTVVVSYNRLELLKRTLDSYRDTVALKHLLVVVDNASDPETRRYLRSQRQTCVVLLGQNHYPGFAANRGWMIADERNKGKAEFSLFHRSDNDVEYLPGWCDEVVERFDENPNLGQLGLRTLAEEGPHAAVGGNCVISKDAYRKGARYPEDGWHVSAFEDSVMSQRINSLGLAWDRARRPCIVHIGIASRNDPYYQETFRVRGIDFSSYGL